MNHLASYHQMTKSLLGQVVTSVNPRSCTDNENESAAPKVDSIKAGSNPVKKGSIRATKSTQKNQTTLDQHVEKRGNPAKSRSTKKRQRSDSEVDASM